jgi:DNA-directed RNA polymerase alpha subunit
MANLSTVSENPKSDNTLISFKQEENGILNFTIDKINVSFTNAIRRTILSNIPTLVFKCFPDDKNNATFHINTSRLNNEILKQRLQCIPIHISDLTLPYSELVVEINMKNETENTIDLTTEHFKIKNEKTDKYLNDEAVRKIFPPCSITGDFILFARLRPKISTLSPGEELSVSARMSLHTAEEDGAFNVASTCAYKFTVDKIKQDEVWQNKLSEISQEEKSNSDIIALLQQNWYNHEGLRYFKNDSFDFKVESIGVFSNENLVYTACSILIEKLQNIATDALQETLKVEKSISTIHNSVDIVLEGYGYTIGKILEYMLNNNFYQGEKKKILNYIGFRKNHPHDEHSIIRLGFINKINDESEIPLESYAKHLIKESCIDSIAIIEEIKHEFNN